MPLTIIVVATVYGRDMMTMSEMKTNDTMQKTTSTMNDASECVSARTCGSHAPSRMRPHDAKPVAPEQSKDPCNAHRWQQMMRARLGIDKTKSWADWAEEEEEAAELTKTLEAATADADGRSACESVQYVSGLALDASGAGAESSPPPSTCPRTPAVYPV